MRVTVAMDNCVPTSARGPFIGEHGLSLLIEHEGRRVLFDTGQTGAVIHNLSLLGIQASSLDAIVVSHGHYDHIGGIVPVLQNARKAMPVYAHSGIFKARVSVAGERHFVGVPFNEPFLRELGAQWHFCDQPTEVIPGLWFSGKIPRQTDYEKGDANLMTCDGECCQQDPLDDDCALFHSTREGLRVIGGCTHSGMINTVKYGFSITGLSHLHTWIGGTHLGPVSQTQKAETLRELDVLSPDLVAANHCTGFEMMAVLRQRLGPRFIPAFVGTVIEW